jgi:hypothetical protein
MHAQGCSHPLCLRARCGADLTAVQNGIHRTGHPSVRKRASRGDGGEGDEGRHDPFARAAEERQSDQRACLRCMSTTRNGQRTNEPCRPLHRHLPAAPRRDQPTQQPQRDWPMSGPLVPPDDFLPLFPSSGLACAFVCVLLRGTRLETGSAVSQRRPINCNHSIQIV